MSTAQLVPETWELTGDDARSTLARTGHGRLVRDAFLRLRWADGFSHSRSLAFLIALSAVQGIIAVVGLATAFNERGLSRAIVTTVRHVAPGPVSGLLTQTITQAQQNGASHNYLGLVLGTVGCLVSSTTALGQLERGLNRIYGVEQDRGALQKYGLAALLALSVGVLVTIAFGLIAFGRTVGSSTHSEVLARGWSVLSWPLGIALMGSSLALLFRWCPRRRQPAWSWLTFGATVSLVLSTLVTLALGLFFRNSASFGRTYGPLAGVVALLMWALLISMAVFFGAAVAAQLEAVRADAANPQDDDKVESSEPSAAPNAAANADHPDSADPPIPARA